MEPGKLYIRVYCKDCRYFPRLSVLSKSLAVCKKREVHAIEWYSDSATEKHNPHIWCDKKNENNDCQDFKKRRF